MTRETTVEEYLGVAAIFASEAMRQILSQVKRAAPSEAAILITGESGCGKEIVARAIHHYSPRRAQSWVDINCAALPESLLESELFGHEKGAFSGAGASKPGLFEMARGGTLFLDEIGDLDPRMQVKLLRVLDGASYYRVGGVKKVSVDVRLVTATNRDLNAASGQGSFRADLFHRLSQIHIPVPPLRERREDVLPLAMHYLSQQKPGWRFHSEAVEMLRAYSWPGNVRELRNVVMRAAVFASGPEILASDLPPEFDQSAFSSSLRALAVLPEMERSAIMKALADNQGHQRRAAERLGISTRTLQRKIKSYGLVPRRRLQAVG